MDSQFSHCMARLRALSTSHLRLLRIRSFPFGFVCEVLRACTIPAGLYGSELLVFRSDRFSAVNSAQAKLERSLLGLCRQAPWAVLLSELRWDRLSAIFLEDAAMLWFRVRSESRYKSCRTVLRVSAEHAGSWSSTIEGLLRSILPPSALEWRLPPGPLSKSARRSLYTNFRRSVLHPAIVHSEAEGWWQSAPTVAHLKSHGKSRLSVASFAEDSVPRSSVRAWAQLRIQLHFSLPGGSHGCFVCRLCPAAVAETSIRLLCDCPAVVPMLRIWSVKWSLPPHSIRQLIFRSIFGIDASPISPAAAADLCHSIHSACTDACSSLLTAPPSAR